MTNMDLKDQIRSIFRRHGFPWLGFTRPEVPAVDLAVLDTWLERGDAAGMAYMSRGDTLAKRRDPRLLFEPVRTVLVAAYPYPPPPVPPGSPRIAAYTAGIDYHHHLPGRLDRAMEEVQELAGQPLRWRSFTDSAPILERSLAVQAGLGWVGRNSLVLIPGYGSWFLLAEVFTDLDIPADEPFVTDHCGTCRRCVEACPTSCIRGDRTVDANRCLSWLTIENRADIAPELQEPLGDWLFGCDICQEVCPWNRFAFRTPAEPAGLMEPDLAALAQMTDEDFRLEYRRSALYRAHLEGLQRNLAVTQGNNKGEGALVLLGQLVSNPSVLVRRHALDALARHTGARRDEILRGALRTETDPDLRKTIRQLLE